MLKVFEPRYTPQTEQHLVDTTYLNCTQKICKQTSDGLQWYAITCDGWSSRANHSYLSVTLYYINNEWELKHLLLETGEMVEQHTAINLANYLEEVLDR